jgi:hypothetical protein
MIFGGVPFLTSPFPWTFLAALAAGAAVSAATRSTRRAAHPEAARTRKWVFFCLSLCLVVILGLCAVFVPGQGKILDVRLAYLFAAVTAVSFPAFRFRKAVGIPVLLLALATVVSCGLFLRSVRAYTGETEIAKVRVISADGSGMKLELVPGIGEAEVLDMEGQYFAPVVKVIIFDDFWVFLGARTWYRFLGMTSFRVEREGDKTVFRQGDTDRYFPHPEGVSDAVYSLFEKYERFIPGVKTVQVSVDMKRAREPGSYSIRVQNDGGVEIVTLAE